jgi:EpsI family protein
VKIHRPELCYPAQGWTVKSTSATSFAAPSVAGGAIPGFRLITQSQDGSYELVSYWIRIGNTFSQGGLSTRLAIIKEGLQGKMVDGILVRASQRTSDLSNSAQKFALQEKLLAEMAGSIKNTPDNVLIN